MSSKCIDINDQITQSKAMIGNSPISKPNGELNVYAIEKFKVDFLEGIKEDGLFDPVSLQVSQYGDSFYNSMTDLTALLNTSDLSNYPELGDRWSKGQISFIEYADFIGAYNYTPAKIVSSSRVGDVNLLRNLNSYYRDSNGSILGGFCNLMPQVFGAIGGFFTIIGSVSGLINDALSFLGKIKNLEDPIRAIIEKLTVTQLIKQIKEKMTAVIEETWESIKSAVQNFSIEEVVGQVSTYIKENVFAKAARIKSDISAILTDENKKTLTDKIKALFDYATGLFSNPSLEEIQFLIARFCSLVSNVEALIKDIKTPMDNYAFKYQRIVGRLKRVSGMVTAGAVSSGAIRFDEQTRQEEINRMRDQWQAPVIQGETLPNPQDEVRTPDVDRPERLPNNYGGCDVEENIPSQHHTPTGRPPNNAPPPTAGDFDGIPTWDEIKDGNHPKIAFVSGMGELGWTGLAEDTKARLMRLQELTGQKLTITSGFRSEQYQESLRRRYAAQGKSRGRFVEGRGWTYGVAFYSQHLLGKALDVSYGNWSRSQFIDNARRCGFKHFITYNSFIHIDTTER